MLQLFYDKNIMFVREKKNSIRSTLANDKTIPSQQNLKY